MSKKKRQHILTYHTGRRGWVKKYQGKQHWILYSPKKSDREKYNEAVKVWLELKSAIDAGEYQRVQAARARIRKQSSAQSSRKSNPRMVKSAVLKFLDTKQGEVNGGQITIARLKNLEYGLSPFREKFGGVLLSTIKEQQIQKFQREQLNRVSAEEIKPATLDQQFRSVRQFLRWCWKQKLVNELPRNLEDLTIKVPRPTVSIFTSKEIKALWVSIGKSHLHPRWKSRTGEQVDHEILRAMMLLGLNCGYTQMDVSTLRVHECGLNKRPPVVIKHRSKTDVSMRHLLWRETKELLKKRTEGKRPREFVFTRVDGTPILKTSKDSSGNLAGGRSTWIGDKFKRLV